MSYITGEINYCNWPMIVSKEGNKKMFIDTKWAYPYEQTWSSHIYQLEKDGKINAGLLLRHQFGIKESYIIIQEKEGRIKEFYILY